MTATADLPNKNIKNFTEKFSFAAGDKSIIVDSEDGNKIKLIAKTLMKGDTGATPTSAAIVGDDIVFTKDDGNTVTITGAVTTLKGDPGTPGTNGADGDSFTWLGVYSAGTTYQVNDVVSYNGSSYICILESTGNLPTNGTYWSLVAQKGADGLGSGDMLKATYDPTNKNGDAFSMDNMVEGSTTKIMTGAERTKLSGIATGATANDTDANLKNRANHTGTQTASTISDFDTAVSSNSAVTANTAKVSNATHTGDVTGSTTLTIANGAVTKAKTDSGVQASLGKADTALQSGDIGTTIQEALVSGTNIKTVGGTTLLGSGDIDGGTGNIGYKNIPANSKSANYTLVLGDAGKSIDHPSSDANERTFTIPANSSVAYPIGTTISFSNMTSQVVTIAITTDTMYLAGDGDTGSRTLAQYGVATIRKLTATTRLISGVGLT